MINCQKLYFFIPYFNYNRFLFTSSAYHIPHYIFFLLSFLHLYHCTMNEAEAGALIGQIQNNQPIRALRAAQ